MFYIQTEHGWGLDSPRPLIDSRDSAGKWEKKCEHSVHKIGVSTAPGKTRTVRIALKEEDMALVLFHF